MSKIVIDRAEYPYVFEAFDRLEISYIKEQIAFKYTSHFVNIKGSAKWIDEETYELIKDTYPALTTKISNQKMCDFTNENRSFAIERKRVDDFYESMGDGRLIKQAAWMYKYASGPKIIILEGMGSDMYFEDGGMKQIFDDLYDTVDLRKSPIQQVIDMHPDKEPWIWRTISDLASYNVFVCQTWNVEETAKFVHRINKGIDDEPQFNIPPLKVPGLNVEETMLTAIEGIGKKTAKKLIKDHGSLGKLISAIRKMKKAEVEKYQVTRNLKKVFGY